MSCCDEVTGNGAGGASAVIGFDVDEAIRTTDATPFDVRLAQLIGNAEGNGVTVAVSIFALSDPVSGPGQFSYNLWGFAARLGVASGAVQYGDITAGVGGFGLPVLSVTPAHVVIVTLAGLAATDVDWRVTARVIPIRGATP